MERVTYDINWGGLWKILAFVVLAWIAYITLDILLAILVAMVIAAGLDAPVSWLKRRGVPRLLSTLLIFIVGIVFVAAIIYTIVPLAISDFTQLATNLRQYAEPFFGTFQASDIFTAINEKLDSLADSLISGSIPLTQVAASFFGNIFLAMTVLILAFYLTVGQDGIEKFLTSIVPTAYEDSAIDLYLKTRHKIGQWLKGQVLLSLVIGFTVFLGLSILGVKYSLLLGILAGLFEIIPFVGPIFSGSIAVLIALSSSLTLAAYALILFMIIQQLENNVLVPLVMKYTVNLDPAVVLISILIGGKIFGFYGLILAVPASVFIQEVIEKWTAKKKKNKGLI